MCLLHSLALQSIESLLQDDRTSRHDYPPPPQTGTTDQLPSPAQTSQSHSQTSFMDPVATQTSPSLSQPGSVEQLPSPAWTSPSHNQTGFVDPAAAQTSPSLNQPGSVTFTSPDKPIT